MAKNLRIWIGRRIRVLRTKRGWTQQMLADHAEISREHLSELENGKWDATAKLIQKVAGALGIGLEEFFRGS